MDKIHDDFEHSEFETPRNQKIEKTPVACLKEKDNNNLDQVNKLPDMSKTKQLLDEDRNLQTDAMHCDKEVCIFSSFIIFLFMDRKLLSKMFFLLTLYFTWRL